MIFFFESHALFFVIVHILLHAGLSRDTVYILI
nr:MAG TPA_asm: hypothetical protein [Caudoviricetes sp.]